MSDINPTPPTPPDGPKQKQDHDAGKKPKSFGSKGPSGGGGVYKPGESFKQWFDNKKQYEQFCSQLSQSISTEVKKNQQDAAKAARKMKASEEGKDPDDVS